MQILSTDTAPSHEAFAYWRGVLAQHFVHLRPERVGLGPFRSTIEAQQLEGYSFSRVTAAPQRVHRAIREIARSPYDLVFLNLHLRGEGSFRQEGDELVLNPGDLFILDAVRPFELGCEGGVTQISLKVPRQILWERMRRPDGARGTRIPGTSHIGKLLSGYIKTLWRRGETEQKTGDPSAMDHLFSLVAYEVDRRHGDAALPRSAVRAGIYACAVSCIGEAHGMPELTPRSVAHAVGTSLRTLQNIFAERQDAISRHIQNRRITTVARWLAYPAMREQTIGQLAFMPGSASCHISLTRSCAPTRKPRAPGAGVTLEMTARLHQIGTFGAATAGAPAPPICVGGSRSRDAKAALVGEG